jgi:hypothetical protein
VLGKVVIDTLGATLTAKPPAFLPRSRREQRFLEAGERFEGRPDGNGLVLTWRPDRTSRHATGGLRYASLASRA